MDGNHLRVGDVHMLHLTRNAVLSGNGTPERQTEDGSARFYVFDYFDKLVCRRGGGLDHQACFGLDGASDTPVASHYLTLASLEGEETGEDPFFYIGERQDALSDKPFLSIVMVTILAKEKKEGGKTDRLHTAEAEVNGFLRACAGELRQAVADVCREMQGNRRHAPAAGDGDAGCDGAVFRVFHCVSSGNFCIAVRSRCPEFTYHVAQRVRGLDLNSAGRFGFPSLGCSTFTITAMEYRQAEDGSAETLPQAMAEEIRSGVALRLSLTDQGLFHRLRALDSQAENDGFKGLYGRYDLTLSLTLTQFRQIYPWLCACKFKTPLPTADQTAAPDGGAAPDPLVALLREALTRQGVQCVNERILVDVPEPLTDSTDGQWRSARQLRVLQENQLVREKLGQLTAKGRTLPFCQTEYHSCISLLRDLWESYSSLRFQDDSFVNGNMFLAQIWLLLEVVEGYIDSIDKDSAVEQNYKELLIHLRKAVNSISHFQKLMQSINQQSLQAPSYEVQMHTDLEKFMVAYTEFSRLFLADHFKADGRGAEDDKQHILPIFTVDVMNHVIMASPLFLLPYRLDRERGLCRSNPNRERLLLPIIVPDIDTFGNLYTTLPLICHELSHNFRVLSRRERNDVLCRFILHKAAQYAVRQWVSRAGEASAYAAFGLLEDGLLIPELEAVLEAAYREHCRETHDTANVGVLQSNLKSFLMQYFFIDQDAYIRQTPELTPGKVRGFLERLGRSMQERGVLEDADWYPDYLKCRQDLQALQEERMGEAELISLKAAIPDDLRRLSGKMVTDLYSELFGRILAAGIQLDKYVKYHWPDSGAVRTLFLQQIGALCGPDAVSPNRFAAAAETDRWIGEIRETVASACDGLKVIWETHAGDAALDRLRVLCRNLDYVTLDCCETIKDTNHLFHLLFNYWYLGPGRLESNRTERRKLLKGYHARLRTRVEQLHREKRVSWILHSAGQIQALMAPLGIDLEDPSLFCATLDQVLHGVPVHTLSSLVSDSVTLYREVFADLGMCTALGLDVFGYLKVLSHTRDFYEGCREDAASNMKLDRMLLVCYTLVSDAALGFPGLRDSCGVYLSEMCACVEALMTQTGRSDPDYRSFRRRLEQVLAEPERADVIPAMPNEMRALSSWLAETHKQEYYALYQHLQHLWNLVHFAAFLLQGTAARVNEPLLTHFRGLYRDVLTRGWREVGKRYPSSAVPARVGAAYNSPRHEDFFPRENQRFKDTLAFVLYYYYHSWNVFSTGCGHEMPGDWIERLMGGGKDG